MKTPRDELLAKGYVELSTEVSLKLVTGNTLWRLSDKFGSASDPYRVIDDLYFDDSGHVYDCHRSQYPSCSVTKWSTSDGNFCFYQNTESCLDFRAYVPQGPNEPNGLKIDGAIVLMQVDQKYQVRRGNTTVFPTMKFEISPQRLEVGKFSAKAVSGKGIPGPNVPVNEPERYVVGNTLMIPTAAGGGRDPCLDFNAIYFGPGGRAARIAAECGPVGAGGATQDVSAIDLTALRWKVADSRLCLESVEDIGSFICDSLDVFATPEQSEPANVLKYTLHATLPALINSRNVEMPEPAIMRGNVFDFKWP